MKKRLILLTTVGLRPKQAYDTETKICTTKVPKATPAQQPVGCILYPGRLRSLQKAGTVVILFRVNFQQE